MFEQHGALDLLRQDRELFFDGIDRANPGPRAEPYRKLERDTRKFAERLPAYGRLVASTANELWVGPLTLADETLGILNPSPPEETVWSVYSLRGEWLSDVTLPRRFRLMDVGANHVVGIARDADDAMQVVVYPLVRE